MAKYDVYPNAHAEGFLLDVQSDLLDVLNTRVVVPLLDLSNAPTPAAHLNPVFRIEGREVVMVTQFLAAVPGSVLQRPVTSLDAEHAQITRALDMVFQGF